MVTKTNRWLIICLVMLLIVFIQTTAKNTNKQKGRNHRVWQNNQKFKHFDNKVRERNRTKIVETVSLHNNTSKQLDFGNSILKNMVNARSPQVTHIKTFGHYLDMRDLNNSEFNKEICNNPEAKREAKSKWGCKPRETVIHLEHKDGYILSPNAVTVNRCDGMCNLHSKCTPDATRKVEFQIKEVQNGQPTCGYISIIEHTSCKCICPQRSTNCTPYQIYDQEECKCKCPHVQECKSTKKEFDTNECKCKCKKTRKCTTGTKWDDNRCRCTKR